MKYCKEKDLQARVKDAIIKRYGKNVYYIHPRSRVQKDLLDIYLCFYGRFVTIELKKDLQEYGATKIQLYQMNKIREAGGATILVDNLEDVLDALEIIKPKRKPIYSGVLSCKMNKK